MRTVDPSLGDEESFVETVVESLGDDPANYNESERVNSEGGNTQTATDRASELGSDNFVAD